jgi:branched-chain amino acid transport system ATP-binding protein
MVALAPAIAIPPAILVVDELSHGLSPIVVGQMFEIIARLKGDVTMVVIEQFTDRALALADSVVALGRGVVLFDGPAATVTDEDAVSWYALDVQDGASRIGVA